MFTISLARIILSSKGPNLVHNAKRFLRLARDRRICRLRENNEPINENQSRPCLLGTLMHIYVHTLSTCAQYANDKSRSLSSTFCTCPTTDALSARAYIFICAGTFDA